MIHHATVYKEGRYWTSECTCTRVFSSKRWALAFDYMFFHVTGTRRIEEIGGVGFGIP